VPRFQSSTFKRLAHYASLLAIVAACGRQQSGPTPNAIVEYCGTPKALTGETVTVAGSAKFENLSLSGCASGAACAYTVTPTAIRFAEIRVTSQSGQLTQCAETDSTGAFSFLLPKSSGPYVMHVASRSGNDQLQAYVLNNNIDNGFYTLDLAVTSGANQTGLSLLAPSGSATSRTAGAFNILNELMRANDYLRTNTATSYSTDPSTHLPVGGCANGSHFPNCQPFTVGPLVYAYWSKGVNPAGTDSGVSYYVPGTSSLYILGGINGVVDGQDTDEFDPSVIIHEYGHFLEDHYGHSDSPGGGHNGNSIIDPRLAWSEGWADFFQAAVRGENTYADTKNYTSGSGYYQIYEYLSNVTGPPAKSPSLDLTQSLGEGTYREFSVTRALWSVLNTNSFAEIWSVFSGTGSISGAGSTTGFHSSDWHFRNVSLLHKLQSANKLSAAAQGWGDWSAPQASENQYANLSSYTAPLAASGICGSAQVLNPDTQFNMHAGDAFYDFVPSYSGAHALTLTYLVPHTQQIDVDLYVYHETYSYFCKLDAYGDCNSLADVVRKGVVASNAQTDSFTPATSQECVSALIPAGTCANFDRATVTLNADLGAGQHYLINPSAYTLAVSATTPRLYFTLSINGQNQCPQP
jgi:hypothetical protein